MKIKLFIAATLFAGLFALSCASPAGNTSSTSSGNANSGNVNTNSNTAEPAKEPPSPETLAELEKRALEAWKKKEAKAFEGLLADNFVSIDENGKRIGKEDLLKMVSTSNCNFKDYSFSNERVIPAGSEVAVLLMQVNADYKCGGKQGPSQVSSASAYVRSGNTWKAVYHAEVPFLKPDPTKPQPPATPESSKPAASDSPAGGNGGDPLTDALMAIETKGWQAWQDRDQKQLEDMTAKDLALIDPVGGIFGTKNDVMKALIGPNCDIKSFSVTGGKATQITSDVAILTYKGAADAICNGQPIEPIWGTTIFLKSGDTWKPMFIVESPA